MIQHVTLEVREADVVEEAGFWALLGFEQATKPAGMEGRSVWVERRGLQVHLAFELAPVIPPRGHVGVVVADFDAAVEALRAAGHPVDPRAEHWGAARIYTRTPAGHVVEVMAAPPPNSS